MFVWTGDNDRNYVWHFIICLEQNTTVSVTGYTATVQVTEDIVTKKVIYNMSIIKKKFSFTKAAIHTLQSGLLFLSQKEKDGSIFICFKEF